MSRSPATLPGEMDLWLGKGDAEQKGHSSESLTLFLVRLKKTMGPQYGSLTLGSLCLLHTPYVPLMFLMANNLRLFLIAAPELMAASMVAWG